MGKIFGVGWAKTGTTTLGECFKILGFKHQSQQLALVKDFKNKNLTNIFKLVEANDTFEDWPWILLFKELDEAFPDSYFILTERSPDRWVRSYRNMLQRQGEASKQLNEIRRTIYGLPFPNVTEEQLVERYLQHNQAVTDRFKDRPQSFIRLNWENGDGWEELCNFIGKEVPNQPFPHANKGKYNSWLKSLALLIQGRNNSNGRN